MEKLISRQWSEIPTILKKKCKRIRQCRYCGSELDISGNEYGFGVERKVLNIKNRVLEDVGADSKKLIPVFIGLVGYKVPKPEFNHITAEKNSIREIVDYLIEIK